MSVVLVDEFGVEQLSNTLGIVLLFDGISTMVGPPIASNYLTTFICLILSNFG